MSVAIKTDPELWEKVKKKWKRSSKGGTAGEWNARKAQLAVQEYKRLGGKYKGQKKNNSLKKWTDEKWDYVDGKKGNRYLPETVREKLTPSEKRTTNRQKKAATASGKQYAPYSKSVADKMRAAGVF